MHPTNQALTTKYSDRMAIRMEGKVMNKRRNDHDPPLQEANI
jgi:hypothetical protein